MGVFSGILAQFGDLMASKIKRFYNIKDFGKIMPGHGGIMDRIDSLLVVSFVSILYIKFFIF
jgi:phosphatidate cytidylyltransferase